MEGINIDIYFNTHLSSAPIMTVVSLPFTMDTEGSAMQLECIVLIMTLLAWPRALINPLIGADPPTTTFAPEKEKSTFAISKCLFQIKLGSKRIEE